MIFFIQSNLIKYLVKTNLYIWNTLNYESLEYIYIYTKNLKTMMQYLLTSNVLIYMVAFFTYLNT